MQPLPRPGNCHTFVATSLLLALTALEAADNQTPGTAPTGTVTASPAVTGQDELHPEVRKFVIKTAKGNIGEIVLGAKARNDAKRQDVREFGDRMVKDHTKAAQELRPIAEAYGLKWPSEPTQEQQQLVAELSKISGDAFDTKFMEAMVKEHEKNIEAFETMMGKVQDKRLQQFIEETLPVLKKHLEYARAIEGTSPQAGR